jgi:hypothetical protein
MAKYLILKKLFFGSSSKKKSRDKQINSQRKENVSSHRFHNQCKWKSAGR